MAEGAPQLRVPAGPLASLLRPSDAFKAQHEEAGQKRKRDDTPQAVKSPPKVLLAQP